MSMMQRLLEENLLRKGTNKLGIYQLRRGDEFRYHRFISLQALLNSNLSVRRENYHLMYVMELAPDMTLDSISHIFSEERPVDFYGHSLSSSDIIVLQRGGMVSAFYVNSSLEGDHFSMLPDFIRTNGTDKPISVNMRGIPTESGGRADGYILVNGTVLLDKYLDVDKKCYTNGIGKNGLPTGLCYYPFAPGGEIIAFSERTMVREED